MFLRQLTLTAFALVAAAIGLRTLSDPDLGWHLAGGLWILENYTVPRRDPFSAEGAYWWDYSWLFQLSIAAVFSAGGFTALMLLQALLAGVSGYLIAALLLPEAACKRRSEFLGSLAAILVTFFLVAPVWYLRPQLLSLIFFTLLISRGERVTARFLVPLTILWANVHVYWILSPAAVTLGFRSGRDRRRACLLFASVLCGLVSPYFIENIVGLFEYAFAHEVANTLVREFQPLGLTDGYLPWFVLLAAIGLLSSARQLPRRELLLTAILALLSLWQIKFTPLFAVSAAPLLARSVFPRWFPSSDSPISSTSPRRGMPILRISSALSLAALVAALPAPVPEEYLSLFQIARALNAEAPQREQIRVLNHFDTGGWLALAFWLARRERESPMKTFIDGRTLVMGSTRLRQFQLLWSRQSETALSEWQPDIAILQSSDSLIDLIAPLGHCHPSSGEQWKVITLRSR